MPGTAQAERLAARGASAGEIEELLRYNENLFELAALGPEVDFPLPDEPFVAVWERWAEAARERGAFAVLREHLPQLRFPVREGISQSEAYRAATARGVPPEELPEATGLPLARPELVELAVHASPAGRIPLLVVRGRDEFVLLVQALAKRNEPVQVPATQGAVIVGGYTNWTRLHGLRRDWEALDPAARPAATWAEELKRLLPRRELYQDRFIVLSDGPYSGVAAGELGLEEAAWRELSLRIRRDHECAHYFTRRLFGSMRNNLLDELIADYVGTVAATGGFRADWFLRFIGLEPSGACRPGARLELYRGDPPLSSGARRVLHALVASAAANLERFAGRLPPGPPGPRETALTIATLATLRLEDLAAAGADRVLARTRDELRQRLGAVHGR